MEPLKPEDLPKYEWKPCEPQPLHVHPDRVQEIAEFMGYVEDMTFKAYGVPADLLKPKKIEGIPKPLPASLRNFVGQPNTEKVRKSLLEQLEKEWFRL